MSYARRASLDLLSLVLNKKLSLDIAMERSEAFSGLRGVDRGFAHMLTATTLRRMGQIDALLNQNLDKPGPVEPEMVQHILRLGITQLIYMNVPIHAALHETVDLCKSSKVSRYSGLVNAVLRNISRQDPANDIGMINYHANIPAWLYQQWEGDYGAQEAELITKASLAEAPTDITVKKPEELSFWAETLDAVILPTGSLRLKEYRNIEELPGYHEGAWWVQDIAASLPVKILGDLHGKRALDLCAAPGGKTLQLAAAGAEVTALDRSNARMKRLDQNIERMKLSGHLEIVVADALSWNPKEKYDIVLLDAPCSATGTIRRHPDLLHLKSATDLEKLTKLQANILARIPDFIASGGAFIYSTCSLQEVEGARQIEMFLQNQPAFGRCPVQSSELQGLEQVISPIGDLRCFPHHLSAHGGMDGFYVARLSYTE